MSTENLGEIACKIVGDSGIGKTSLLLTYMMQKFPTETEILNARQCCPGLESATIKGASCTIELYDTCTREEYSKFRLLGYQDMQVLLIGFSVVLPSSVESLKTLWIPEVTRYCGYIPFLLIGTQTDLRDDEMTLEKMSQNNSKPITTKEGEKLAKELNAVKYLECSCVTQDGLEDLVKEIASTAQAEPRTWRKNLKRRKKCLIM